MNNSVKKALALAMVAAMALTGCGGSTPTSKPEDSKSENNAADKKEDSKEAAQDDKYQIKDLVITKNLTRELDTFNVLYAQSAENAENLTNLVDGLLESNVYGQLQPCIATEWGTEDEGVTWKFKLRDNVKWVDVNGNEKADCNAHDFATGLEWVLNFHKNSSANTSMPLEMIKGAKEYYEYTKTLSEEEAFALTAEDGSKFKEMVGMTTPDDYTVTYECLTKKPYFDTVSTYFCLYPMSAAMVEELGGPANVKSMNNENMWYNGCYTMTSYIQGNEKIYTKNPMYWDEDCHLFDTVTFKMTESGDIAYQLFQNGEVDETPLTESQLKIIYENENDKSHKYLTETIPAKHSYQFHFNFNKKNEDGTPDDNWNKAVANKAFRQSWYYGLNLEDSWKRSNAINPMKCENLFYTMPGICYTSDGTEYTELVREEMGFPKQDGKTNIRYNPEKAEELKKQAMEELSAQGVTFPIKISHFISGGNQIALDGANVLKQIFESCLGTDYVDFEIKTYISSLRQEVYNPHIHCYAQNGWGADYGDPQNFLGQEVYGYDNADYSAHYSFINEITEENEWNKDLLDTYKEYTRMVEEADKITDNMDDRYRAYAKAEAFMLDNALVIPNNYGLGWAITKINPHSKMNSIYGSVNDKMKNWETRADEPYTTEEMEAIVAAKNAAAK